MPQFRSGVDINSFGSNREDLVPIQPKEWEKTYGPKSEVRGVPLAQRMAGVTLQSAAIQKSNLPPVAKTMAMLQLQSSLLSANTLTKLAKPLAVMNAINFGSTIQHITNNRAISVPTSIAMGYSMGASVGGAAFGVLGAAASLIANLFTKGQEESDPYRAEREALADAIAETKNRIAAEGEVIKGAKAARDDLKDQFDISNAQIALNEEVLAKNEAELARSAGIKKAYAKRETAESIGTINVSYASSNFVNSASQWFVTSDVLNKGLAKQEEIQHGVDVAMEQSDLERKRLGLQARDIRRQYRAGLIKSKLSEESALREIRFQKIKSDMFAGRLERLGGRSEAKMLNSLGSMLLSADTRRKREAIVPSLLSASSGF